VAVAPTSPATAKLVIATINHDTTDGGLGYYVTEPP
jgi:hypothetical protein